MPPAAFFEEALPAAFDSDPGEVEAEEGAERPRTPVEMRLADYLSIQEAKQSPPEAFTSARMNVEGDLAFLMQVGLAISG